jgi:hypothetical protein
VNQLEYRYVAGANKLIITPLYVDDELLAHIVLGAHARRWSNIRPVFEREGMPSARRSVNRLYYLPAQLQFLQRREGLQNPQAADYAEDGPENFGP